MPAVSMHDVLASRGYNVPKADLDSEIERDLAQRLSVYESAGLTTADRQFLMQHGGVDLDAARGSGARAAARAAAHLEGLLRTSLSAPQAADRLGVDASTVRHKMASRSLYAMRVGSRNRLPAWQFTENGVLPHLRDVLAALPPDLHPLEVEDFFVGPKRDLLVARTPVSVRDWLAHGGDPETVEALARDLAVAP